MRRTALAVGVALLAVGAGPAGSSTQSARWFHSPSRNVSCELSVERPEIGTTAFCWTLHPPRCVILEADGRTRAPRNCLIGNPPENAFTLRYGRSVRLGPFRCTSRRVGMRCVVPSNGHGFLISRRRLTRF